MACAIQRVAKHGIRHFLAVRIVKTVVIILQETVQTAIGQRIVVDIGSTLRSCVFPHGCDRKKEAVLYKIPVFLRKILPRHAAMYAPRVKNVGTTCVVFKQRLKSGQLYVRRQLLRQTARDIRVNLGVCKT